MLDHQVREILTDLAEHVEVLVHASGHADDVIAETFGTGPPDRIRSRVVAGRAALLQAGAALLAIERGLGRLEHSAAVRDAVEAELGAR